jgi:hypothetical protein
VAATALDRHIGGLQAAFTRFGYRFIAQKRPEFGALPTLFAATQDLPGDSYVGPGGRSGPQPSEQMTAALARGLRLSLDERDHLFRLAGHATPGRLSRTDHVSPAMMRVLDRLEDTPAQIVTDLAETLAQTLLRRGRRCRSSGDGCLG